MSSLTITKEQREKLREDLRHELCAACTNDILPTGTCDCSPVARTAWLSLDAADEMEEEMCRRLGTDTIPSQPEVPCPRCGSEEVSRDPYDNHAHCSACTERCDRASLYAELVSLRDRCEGLRLRAQRAEVRAGEYYDALEEVQKAEDARDDVIARGVELWKFAAEAHEENTVWRDTDMARELLALWEAAREAEERANDLAAKLSRAEVALERASAAGADLEREARRWKKRWRKQKSSRKAQLHKITTLRAENRQLNDWLFESEEECTVARKEAQDLRDRAAGHSPVIGAHRFSWETVRVEELEDEYMRARPPHLPGKEMS